MIRRSVLAALLAVLLTGCAMSTAGTAMPDPESLRAVPITARAAFGDAVTVRPCSLVDLSALPGGWRGTAPPTESLDSCEFSVVDGGTRPTTCWWPPWTGA